MLKNLKVHLVLHPENQGWVIEKIARRLLEHLSHSGVEATISDQARGDVDLNHWMSYAFANEPQPVRATMFITHIDDPHKVALVRQELASGIDAGICMSSHQVEFLVGQGLRRESLCHVLPAHDNRLQPRRIRIGIATRLYPDGRKREDLLVKLAETLSLDAFEFEIHGAGWEPLVPVLKAAGAVVNHFPGSPDYERDYELLIERMPHFDFYLYLGMDEGSLGTLDAVTAAVPTIVTAQGFHLDLGAGLDHTFTEFPELLAIFRSLAERRAGRLAVAASLVWPQFAARHARIWRAIVSRVPLAEALDAHEVQAGLHRPTLAETWRFRARGLQPRRMLSALARMRVLKPLRNLLRPANDDDRSAK